MGAQQEQRLGEDKTMKKIGRFLSRLYWIAAFILAVVSAFEAESQKLATAGIAFFSLPSCISLSGSL